MYAARPFGPRADGSELCRGRVELERFSWDGLASSKIQKLHEFATKIGTVPIEQLHVLGGLGVYTVYCQNQASQRQIMAPLLHIFM